MKTVEIKPDIFWVGVKDPNLRVFDIVMKTPWGTTYNSYIVKGKKVAVVETVKAVFFDEFLAKLQTVVDPQAIDYLVVNHTEPDHAGSVAKLLTLAPQATVVASRAASQFLKGMVHTGFNVQIVGDGDSVDLGGKTLRFTLAPFLHWPDSMFTYVPEDKVLFTCDAFGCHYCPEGLFNDEEGDFGEAYRLYYDAIMSPFKTYVADAVEKIKDLDIALIAPGHGPVLRDNPRQYVEIYRQWSIENRPVQKTVFIGYVSAYGNTKMLAEAVAAGVEKVGSVSAILRDVSETSEPEIAALIEHSDALIFGSPTINADVVRPVWDAMNLIVPMRNKGKVGAAFGSYGWSGEAVKMIEDRLKSLKLKVPFHGVKANFVPTEAILTEARQLGEEVAKAIL